MTERRVSERERERAVERLKPRLVDGSTSTRVPIDADRALGASAEPGSTGVVARGRSGLRTSRGGGGRGRQTAGSGTATGSARPGRSRPSPARLPAREPVP